MRKIQFLLVKVSLGILFCVLFSNSYARGLPPPELVSPESRAKVSSGSSIKYQWNPVASASQYDFQVYDRQLKQISYEKRLQAQDICDAEMCLFENEAASLTDFGRYVWKVRALNLPQRSKFSRRVLFVSGEKPSIVAPLNQTIHELPEVLSYQWRQSEGAAHYIFRIVDKKQKKVIYRNAKIPTSNCDELGNCTYEPADDFELVPGRYRWTVRAINGFDRSLVARANFSVKAAVPEGVLSDGYDWQLPEYASDNPRGGLVRDAWKDRDYTNSVFYSLRWDKAGLVEGASKDEDNYDFAEFNGWLNYSSDAAVDNIVVRLEVSSRCETPSKFLGADGFNFYAGNTIAFWEEAYVKRLTAFVTQFAAAYADHPRIKGVHLGIADGEYKDGKIYLNTCDTDSPEGFYKNDDGWGEFWVNEEELQSAKDQGLSLVNFQKSVVDIIDVYTDAFGDNTNKLAFTNLENFVYDDVAVKSGLEDEIVKFNAVKTEVITPHVIASGVGNRDGLIEDWMAYNNPLYGIGLRPVANDDSSCSLTMDESFAEKIGDRYWGTENEEYGYFEPEEHNWVAEKFGAEEDQPYRFMMSSLRALQMRRNHMQINTVAMDQLTDTGKFISDYNTADFLNYLAGTMGRDKTDTPDAFVVLGERYVRMQYITGFTQEQLDKFASCLVPKESDSPSYAKVREYGRWLTEVSGQGKQSNPVKLVADREPWSIPSNLPMLDGSSKYEYAARDSHKLKFDINDTVISERCDDEKRCELTVKVVFEDKVATTLSLETDAGTVGRVTTFGDGTTKTATFVVVGIFDNDFGGADFGLQTASEDKSLPVFMARVNFMTE